MLFVCHFTTWSNTVMVRDFCSFCSVRGTQATRDCGHFMSPRNKCMHCELIDRVVYFEIRWSEQRGPFNFDWLSSTRVFVFLTHAVDVLVRFFALAPEELWDSFILKKMDRWSEKEAARWACEWLNEWRSLIRPTFSLMNMPVMMSPYTPRNRSRM